MTSISADLKASSPTMRRALPQSLVAWLFLAPAAFIFAVVLIYPMTYSSLVEPVPMGWGLAEQGLGRC